MVTDKVTLPLPVKRLGEIFEKNGFTLYAVGGCVRNTLLGLPPSDIDVCSAAVPAQVMEMLSREPGVSCYLKCERLGTLGINIEDSPDIFQCEYSAFRTESYGEGGKHTPDEVSFTQDLEKDAFRRDFSVNALYAHAITGEITDPTGGLPDLHAGVIRTTSPDPEWIIRDDGLRILRMVRFACELGFSISPPLFRTAREMVGLLADISKERIREELVKILLADAKYPQLQKRFITPPHGRGLFLLKALGAYAYIAPSLLQGVGVGQRKDYHAYDVFTHLLKVCQASPPDLVLRLAGLFHDVGKPEALRRAGNMYGHDKIGAEMVRAALGGDGLKFDNDTVDTVAKLISIHMFDLDGRAKESTVRRKFSRVGYDMARRLIQIRAADITGSGRGRINPPEIRKWERIIADMQRRHTPMGMRELAITGSDISAITGLPPSPFIGKLKEAAYDYAVQNPERNNKEALTSFINKYLKSNPVDS